MNRFYIETYGCQMNVSDSLEIEALLTSKGMKRTDKSNLADFVFVNTCSVRKTAEDRVLGRLGFYKNLKKKNHTIFF